jgi:ubiquitin carboxyl-terminal hydrolase 14
VPPKPRVSGLYELCAVISHKGRDAEHGHYVAWVKKGEHWLVMDDEHVGVVAEEDVRRLKGVGEAHIAYMLLYRSYDPDTLRPPLLI